MRTLLYRTLIATVVLIALGAMWIWRVQSKSEHDVELENFAIRSPLAAGLSGNIEAAEEEFRQRILDRFPLGSNVIELAHVLAEQGFKRGELPATGDGIRAIFELERSAPFCRLRWMVLSTARRDAITALSANYGAVCL